MTAVTVDLDEVERENDDRIGQLRRRRQELALDALTDERVAKELAGVEDELGEAEAKLERLGLAANEQARREHEARETAAVRAREDALDQARTAAVERAKAAKAINAAATKLGRAIADYQEAHGRMNNALTAAGRRPEPRVREGRLTETVAYGLGQAGVRRNLELPPLSAPPTPMDEQPPKFDQTDPEPVVVPGPPPAPKLSKPNSPTQEYAWLVKRYGRERARNEWAAAYNYEYTDSPDDPTVEMFERMEREIERAANTNGEHHV